MYTDGPRGGSPRYFSPVYHVLIELTYPLFITLSLSPCSCNIQQLTIQSIMLCSYIDGLFQYFSLSAIFFSSPASCSSLRQTH
jgi:hypothetical protein